MSADFLQLYLELGIDAGCTPEEFRHACRRRIAEMHPDKHPDRDAPDRHAELPLDELLALYARAMQFHERYGRLPGARSPSPWRAAPSTETGDGAGVPPACAVATTQLAMPTFRAASSAPAPAPAPGAPLAPRRHRQWGYAAAGALAIAAFAYVGAGSQVETGEADADAAAVGSALEPAPAGMAASGAAGVEPDEIVIGTDPATVIDIQGRPLRMDGPQWEYGPSWLRFEEDAVVDWYSSPLHPLRTATPTPAQD